MIVSLPRVDNSFCRVGPVDIDADFVTIDGHRFSFGEKYTILELGWAVYLTENSLPSAWLRQFGEFKPADEEWGELRSGGGMLVTSHPVLVALALRRWWHRNGRP